MLSSVPPGTLAPRSPRYKEHLLLTARLTRFLNGYTLRALSEIGYTLRNKNHYQIPLLVPTLMHKWRFLYFLEIDKREKIRYYSLKIAGW